ncbi:hypothetical protein GDO86_020214 [Hymenochirus boettgeri]|uniref:Uncharacterized protein n=1 Tax=Hymenochirus boettgeri TaxID=247094 RepID=A0A8T2IID6_9PIPI|nr:hypothetical protein GDO86_020214 [Hymenochirus boettgeri]
MNANVTVSQQSFTLFISKLSLETLTDVLYKIEMQVPASDIPSNVKTYFLNAMWERIKHDPDCACSSFPGSWFQKLSPFLSAINSDILNCMTTMALTCDGFHTVVDALHLAYPTLSNATREMTGNWISKFLRKHRNMPQTLCNRWINSSFRSFKNNVNYEDYVYAWPNISCSALEELTDFQVAQYCVQENVFSNPDMTAVILQFLETKDIFYIMSFLDTLSQMSSSSSSFYDNDLLFSLLKIALQKLNSPESELCKPSFKEIFEFKIGFLLGAVNETVLELLPANMTCSDYQNVFQGIDNVYDSLTDDVKYAVFQYRLGYIRNQTLIAGCTYVFQCYMATTNFGKSLGYLSFSDMIKLNPTFNGFDAIGFLNINQTLDLLIYSDILIEENPSQYEMHISDLINSLRTKDYYYVLEFLAAFNEVLQQHNISTIRNHQVRCLMLDGLWRILRGGFNHFSSDDWETLFNVDLPIFLPCIQKTQLSSLTLGLVKNCSSFQMIVKGLDAAFEYMTLETIEEVASWIITFLRSTRCDSNDWLISNFQRFRIAVNVTVILELNSNFNPLDVLEELTANQIGEVVLYVEAARTNVSVMEHIFDVLENVPSNKRLSNLGDFWDSFNNVFKTNSTVTFTDEVKYVMLNRTSIVLLEYYYIITEQEFYNWVTVRLDFVLNEIDQTILGRIPLSISCFSFETIISVLSAKYSTTSENKRLDVFGFIFSFLDNGTHCETPSSSKEWLLKRFGSYSTMATYEDIIFYNSNFNPYETGVLSILSMEQIGDMMVFSNTLNRIDEATILFGYLKTLTISNVEEFMRRFTLKATEKETKLDNVEVGKYILLNYLKIVESQIQMDTSEYLIERFDFEFYFFIRFFTNQTLLLIPIRDCDTLIQIVIRLDRSYDFMSPETLSDIVEWLVNILKQRTLNGCYSNKQTQQDWIEVTWKRFFALVPLKDIMEVNPRFDPALSINNTSILQKIDFIVNSDALINVTKMAIVLGSLKGSDNTVSVDKIFEFLLDFNIVFEKLTVQTISFDVRQEVMLFLFEQLAPNLRLFTFEQMENVSSEFKYFLSGISIEVLDLIPKDISCVQFYYLFSAFNSVYNMLTDDLAEQIFNFILSFLNYQLTLPDTPATNVCGMIYGTSEAYIKNVFFNFSIYATIYELEHFNVNFNPYDVLSYLSGAQLGNLLMNSTAIRNQMEAIPILVELEKRKSYKVVVDFMDEFNRVAEKVEVISTLSVTQLAEVAVQFVNLQNEDIACQIVGRLQQISISNVYLFLDQFSDLFRQSGIVHWPNLNVQSKFLSGSINILKNEFSAYNNSQWELLFSVRLKPFLLSIQADELNTLLHSADCDSYPIIVSNLNDIFDDLSSNTCQSIYSSLYTFLKTNVCTRSNDTDEDWFLRSFGQFRIYAPYSDIIEIQPAFNGMKLLNNLSSEQLAGLLLSGLVLSNESNIEIFARVLQAMTFNGLDIFLGSLQTIAAEKNVVSISMGASVFLDAFYGTIADRFKFLTADQWMDYWEIKLSLFLGSITEDQINLIPVTINCEKLQIIVTAMDKHFKELSTDIQQAFYEKIKSVLLSLKQGADSACSSGTFGSAGWLKTNLASFSVLATYDDIITFKPDFIFTDALSVLTAEQLGWYCVKTQAFKDSDKIALVMDAVDKHNIGAFIDGFNDAAKQNNITQLSSLVARKFFVGEIFLHLGTLFPKFTLEDYIVWFKYRLAFFINILDAKQFGAIPSDISCDVLASLVEIFTDTSNIQDSQAIYNFIISVLNQQKQMTGDPCTSSDLPDYDWLLKYFGKFTAEIAWDSLRALYPTFNAVNSKKLLTGEQLGQAVVTSALISNVSSINIVFDNIGLDLEYLYNFTGALQCFILKEPNAVSSKSLDTLLMRTLEVVFHFAQDLSIADAEKWMSQIEFLLPNINGTMLELLPLAAGCEIYQAVIHHLDNVYLSLTSQKKMEVYHFEKSYLQNHFTPGEDAPCIHGSQELSEWLQKNMGRFCRQSTVNDTLLFYPGLDEVSYNRLCYLS